MLMHSIKIHLNGTLMKLLTRAKIVIGPMQWMGMWVSVALGALLCLAVAIELLFVAAQCK